MSLQKAFPLSFYFTLAMACTCLASAETYFFEWTEYALAGVVVLLFVAYWAEGRWHISQMAANHLGLFIAVGAAGWILYSLPRTEQEVIEAGVPWPAGLLPHLGPLLVLLLLVKLFRPKHLSDYWVLQTIALMMVTLGCVLASDLVFGLLLMTYLGSLVWCLSLFYMAREQTRSDSADPSLIPLFSAFPDQVRVPWTLGGALRACRWTLAIVLLGLTLFIAAPREGTSQWLPHNLSNAFKMKSGMDSGIDLNRIGMINLSDEPAFNVFARNHEGPVTNLPSSTRWFVETLEFYQRGAWLTTEQADNLLGLGMSDKASINSPPENGKVPHPKHLPENLPEGAAYLLFYTEKPVMVKPLAYPLGRDNHLGIRPYLEDKPAHQGFFQRVKDRDLVVPAPMVSRDFYYYGQIVEPGVDPVLAPARDIMPNAYQRLLLGQETPEPIRAWVQTLIERVPGLSAAERRLDENGKTALENRVHVAQALSDYLAYSGEFAYSLNLERQHRQRDPSVDFLLHIKEGHCERFAGGLALMLRSIGIPSRVVKGYYGLDNLGNGNYLVRQDRAHSWVQALVKSPQTNEWSWITLDPTPSAESSGSDILALLSWLQGSWSDSKSLWRIFVVDYNADQQRRSAQALWERVAGENGVPAWILVSLGLVAAAALLLLTWWGWRKFASKRRKNAGAFQGQAPGVGWYRKLLKTLADHLRLHPLPGQTPLELSRLAADAVAARSLPSDLASIPAKLVSLLYSLRFGGTPVSAAQELQAEADVANLAQALAALPAASAAS